MEPKKSSNLLASAQRHGKRFLETGALKGWPNRLTLGRILVIPLILVLYPLDFRFTDGICVILFMAAAITDYLDGYLARKHNEVSVLGALLDPVADKMLMATALVVLAHAKQLPPLIAGVLLCRDVLVSGLRMVALEQNFKLEVNQFGKIKTFVADAGIGFLLLRSDEVAGIPAHALGMLAMWAATFLGLYSAYLYVITFSEKANFSAGTDR